jgi:hypothetical protein
VIATFYSKYMALSGLWFSGLDRTSLEQVLAPNLRPCCF